MTPLQFSVRVSKDYWRIIVTVKHPIMAGQIDEVEKTLIEPEIVNRSRSDPGVYLFYRSQSPLRWFCAVARRLNGDGFLITTYPTDAIKAGERLWQK